MIGPFLGVVITLLSWGGGSLGAVPRYHIGELAEEDLRAPDVMAVVDRERTSVLREQAAERIPAIFRFHSNAMEEAEGEMRASFAQMREQFLEAMQTASQRTALDERTVAHPSFRRFVVWFQKQHPVFPLTTNVARLWALGESDRAVRDQWIRRLRAAMEQCIHGDWLPPNFTGTLQHARVVQVDDPGEVLNAKSVESRSVDIKLTNLVSITQSRSNLKRQAALDGEPALGNYLAGFLRLNCFPEEELTQGIREQATIDMVALDRYEAGQLIVRRGQRIDSRIHAALEFLGQTEKTVRVRPPSSRESITDIPEESAWEAWWRPIFSSPARLESAARWGLFTVALLALPGLMLLAYLVRRKGMSKQRQLAETASQNAPYTVVMNEDRQETVFMPLEQSSPEDTMSVTSSSQAGGLDRVGDRFWRERALEAEKRAEDIVNMVRAGLAPQLARQMMTKLVRELITQRAEWIKTSSVAEAELADIERRFAESHAVLQKKLREFEQRTEELEQLLALKTEENSELIKNQIVLTQQQLKEAQSSLEKDKTVLLWN